MNPQVERLFQCIQKFEPQLSLNSEVSQQQLYNLLNNMSKQTHYIEYDYDTFIELYQRAEQQTQFVNLRTYLEVHLQANDILSQRVQSQQQDFAQLKNFTQQLQQHLAKPNESSYKQTDGYQLNIKSFFVSGSDAYNSQLYYLRILSEDQMEQIFPLQPVDKGYYCQPQQRIVVYSFLSQFTVELMDQNQQTIAYGGMPSFFMGIFNSAPIKIFLSFPDGYKREISLTVEGLAEVAQSNYVQQDYVQLKEEEVRIQTDLTSTQDQLKNLNYPFDAIQGSYRQPSHQASFHNQPVGGMTNYGGATNNPVLFDDGYGTGAQLHNTNVMVQGGNKDQYMHSSSNEECDFDSKSLVRNIHYLLIIYLIIAVLFCTKRSMFLDVTIGISFFAVLYRKQQIAQAKKLGECLQIYIGLFATTAALDLAWLIVYFPTWNRDSSSEDQGAQGALRIIILSGSLLFMIYKVLMIVAVFFLYKDPKQGDIAYISINNFLTGHDFPRASQTQNTITASKTYQ